MSKWLCSSCQAVNPNGAWKCSKCHHIYRFDTWTSADASATGTTRDVPELTNEQAKKHQAAISTFFTKDETKEEEALEKAAEKYRIENTDHFEDDDQCFIDIAFLDGARHQRIIDAVKISQLLEQIKIQDNQLKGMADENDTLNMQNIKLKELLKIAEVALADVIENFEKVLMEEQKND